MVKKIDNFSGEYAFLSNFWIEEDGSSNEHFYQAAKATNEADKKKVLDCKTPGQAKRMGRKIEMRKDWESVKLDVMLQGLRKKFSSPDLAKQLLDTGDAELIEGNFWGDRVWGQVDGVGQNLLGILLMKVRAELAEANASLIDEK